MFSVAEPDTHLGGYESDANRGEKEGDPFLGRQMMTLS